MLVKVWQVSLSTLAGNQAFIKRLVYVYKMLLAKMAQAAGECYKQPVVYQSQNYLLLALQTLWNNIILCVFVSYS